MSLLALPVVGGRVFGVGVDICDVRRVAKAEASAGRRFVQRVLSAQEQVVYDQRGAVHPQRGTAFLASRFSAKEAFSKAIGLGFRTPMRWHDCAVLSAPSGQPQLVLSGDLARWCQERGLQFHVSISDERDFVMSLVLAEYDDAFKK